MGQIHHISSQQQAVLRLFTATERVVHSKCTQKPPVGRCEGMPSAKQHLHSTTQPSMIPNHLGMCPGCVGRGTSATGNSGQLLTDPETTFPPLIVAPHACVDAVVDAEAALTGMTCSYNDMHISVCISMSTHGIRC